jgi:hypothetical protein
MIVALRVNDVPPRAGGRLPDAYPGVPIVGKFRELPRRRHECVQGHRIDRDQHRIVGERRSVRGETASKTLRDLRVAEVVKQDIHIDEGGAITYRTKLQVSFKYEDER